MNIGLIFFAIPVAVIIFSIALQKVLHSPILVGLIIFAIFLVITFAINDMTWLILTIVYALIAWITAYIVHLICRCYDRFRNLNFQNNLVNVNSNTNTNTNGNFENQLTGDAELNAALNNINNDLRNDVSGYYQGRGCRRRYN